MIDSWNWGGCGGGEGVSILGRGNSAGPGAGAPRGSRESWVPPGGGGGEDAGLGVGERKEGRGDRLEPKSRVWAGAGVGGPGPGWLHSRSCLHVRVTLGRSPHLSGRQPPALLPSLSLRSGAGLRSRPVQARAPLTSLGLPLSCCMWALSLTLSLLPRTAEFEFLQRHQGR